MSSDYARSGYVDPWERSRNSLIGTILVSEGVLFEASGMGSTLERLPKKDLVSWVQSLERQLKKRDS